MNMSNEDKALLLNNGAQTLSNITLFDNEGNQEFLFSEDDYLSEWNYEDYRYVPEHGFIGEFVERIFDGKLLDIPENISLENKIIKPELGIRDIEHSTTNYYPLGTFIITQVGEKDTNGMYSFQSADLTKKFNILYEDFGKYPCLSLELLNNTCKQVGVEYNNNGNCWCFAVTEDGLPAGNYCFKIDNTYYKFTTTVNLKLRDTLMYVESTNKLIQKRVIKNDNVYTNERTELVFTTGNTAVGDEISGSYIPYYDFTNNDFVIENNQFEADELCRDVVKAIAKLSYTWARVGEDDKLHLDFTKKTKTDVDTYDIIDTDEYYENIATSDYATPINKVLIGMSQVDGENVYDSQNGDRIRLDKLNGETSQITYAGKNHVKNSDFSDGRNSWSDWGAPTTREVIYDSQLGKNVVHLKTGTRQFQGYAQNSGVTVLPNTKYRISFKAKGDYGCIGIHWNDASNNIISQSWSDWNLSNNWATYSATITSPNSNTLARFNIMVGDNTATVHECWFTDIQLEQGETTSAWEPYTGRMPSPNPDYPQEIKTVNGDNNLTIRGKNICTMETVSGTNKGVDYVFDGSEITLNNTTTGSGTIVVSSNSILLKAGTYRLSSRIISGTFERTTQDTAVYIRNKDINLILLSSPGSYNFEISKTVTLTRDANIDVYVYTNGSGMVFNNLVIGLQIEEGSTLTSYEPYHSQIYPVKLKGKNLYNKNDYPWTSTLKYIPLYLGPGTYTMSSSNMPVGISGTCNIFFMNGNVSGGGSSGSNGVSSTVSRTVTTNDGWVTIGGRSTTANNTNNPSDYDFIINEGSSPLTYEDYYSYELCKIGDYQDRIFKNTGSNLYNPIINEGTYNNATYTVASDGKITQSATDNSSFNATDARNFTLPAGTYTFKIIGKRSNIKFQLRNLTDSTNIFETTDDVNTFTLTGTKTLAIKTWGANNVYPQNYYIILNEGSTPQDYEPYGVKGKWYLHKEIGKVVLNGSEESWVFNNSGQTIKRPTLTFSSINNLSTNVGNIIALSYYFKGISYNDRNNYDNSMFSFCDNNNHLLCINSSNWNTLDAFKTWLSTHNTSVYYVLATPTNTEITDTELLNQLNTVNENATTYGGANYIYFDTMNEEPTLDMVITDLFGSETTATGKHIILNGNTYQENAIRIYDNPLTYTQELRQIAINGCDRLFGIEYTPLTINTIGHPWLNGDSYIKITNVNNETLYTYPFNRKLVYKGYINSTLTSTADSQVKQNYEYSKNMLYKIKKTELNVDKANGEITALAKDYHDSQESYTTWKVTADQAITEVGVMHDDTIPTMQDRITRTETNIESIQNLFQITGGSNLIKNSALLLDDETWEFTDVGSGTHYHTPIGQGYDASVIGTAISKATIQLKNCKMTSKIDEDNIQILSLNTDHAFTYAYRLDENTTGIVTLKNATTNEVVYTENLEPTSRITRMQFPPRPTSEEEEPIKFLPDNTSYVLEITTETTYNGSLYIYDLMLNSGDVKSWEPSAGEISSTVLKMSTYGLQVTSTGSNITTLMSAGGFSIYSGDDISGSPITNFDDTGLQTGEAQTTKVSIKNYIMEELQLDGKEHHVEYFKE